MKVLSRPSNLAVVLSRSLGMPGYGWDLLKRSCILTCILVLHIGPKVGKVKTSLGWAGFKKQGGITSLNLLFNLLLNKTFTNRIMPPI